MDFEPGVDRLAEAELPYGKTLSDIAQQHGEHLLLDFESDYRGGKVYLANTTLDSILGVDIGL